jgi:stage III sporulation protein AG
MENKLKGLIQTKIGEEKSDKRKIENLVVFVIILVITIIIINSMWNENKTEQNTENINTKQLATVSDTISLEGTENDDELEYKLAEILKSINGVGDVKVFVNYSETSSVEAMYNENTKISSTEETDTSRRCSNN